MRVGTLATVALIWGLYIASGAIGSSASVHLPRQHIRGATENPPGPSYESQQTYGQPPPDPAQAPPAPQAQEPPAPQAYGRAPPPEFSQAPSPPETSGQGPPTIVPVSISGGSCPTMLGTYTMLNGFTSLASNIGQWYGVEMSPDFCMAQCNSTCACFAFDFFYGIDKQYHCILRAADTSAKRSAHNVDLYMRRNNVTVADLGQVRCPCPGELTSLGIFTGGIVKGKVGRYWGSLPFENVNTALNGAINGTPSVTAEVYAQRGGSSDKIDFVGQLMTVEGFDGVMSPAGSITTFMDGKEQTFAALCAPGQTLCPAYEYGDEVEALYKNLSRRRLLGDCPSCTSNCVCSEAGNNNCFPSNAKVLVQGQGYIAMENLQIGDKVLSYDKNGNVMYDPVFFFGHRLPNIVRPFVHLTSRSSDGYERTVRLSHRHFIPVGEFHNSTMKYAKDVQLDDVIMLHHAKELELVRSVVVFVEEHLEVGMYNPYTKGGHIIVDGVLASCHSDWLLDDIPMLNKWSHVFPTIYQFVMELAYYVHVAIGADMMEVIFGRFRYGYALEKS